MEFKKKIINLLLLIIVICIKIFKFKKSKLKVNNNNIEIKMSSLNYLNKYRSSGFDFKNFYNDFNNEGHMYPLHGVGDLDKTKDIFQKIIKSISGKVFDLTDLGIKIKVSDKTLIKTNPFFDFHNIPVKHLDGSTKLPDGSRIEQHILYFNKNAERDFPDSIADIDWISGNAKFRKIPDFWDKKLLNQIPTTISSTRKTPFLKQNENLALSFFMDGKQSRVTNGGFVNSFRYIAPTYATEINWFVARAWVPCQSNEKNSKKIKTTNGKALWVRPRYKFETDDLELVAYNQNRYMETVSKSISIINTNEKINTFNQRYGNKSVNFGDLMLLDFKNNTAINSKFDLKSIIKKIDDIFNNWVVNKTFYERQKQIAFYEIIETAAKYLNETGDLPSPYVYVQKYTKAYDLFSYIKYNFINLKTYDISITSLVAKSQLNKSYIPSPVGETGWMIVEEPNNLSVPNDDGEYFIGWTIKTQSVNDINTVNESSKSVIRWCQNNGYVIHQGPGIIFLTGGDYAHHGAQEPYLLEHNYRPVKKSNETEQQFKSRKICQLPYVHWRLDKLDIIMKSNKIGNFTETNVGASQNMLLTIGTETCKKLKSRSPNFLGRYYQDLLSNPKEINNLIKKKKRNNNEVYEIVDVSKKIFVFGDKQNSSTINY